VANGLPCWVSLFRSIPPPVGANELPDARPLRYTARSSPLLQHGSCRIWCFCICICAFLLETVLEGKFGGGMKKNADPFSGSVGVNFFIKPLKFCSRGLFRRSH
jgi:hypothetical protein